MVCCLMMRVAVGWIKKDVRMITVIEHKIKDVTTTIIEIETRTEAKTVIGREGKTNTIQISGASATLRQTAKIATDENERTALKAIVDKDGEEMMSIRVPIAGAGAVQEVVV